MDNIKILLAGYCGKMGRAVSELAASTPGYEIAAGVAIDPAPVNTAYPAYFKPSDFGGHADVIVDFSHHSFVESLLDCAIKRGIPLVIATTGHTEDELALIKDAAKTVPILKSANMSLGVNLLCGLAKKAAALLSGYDIEIVERHHNKKLDAPSGTALLLADAVASATGAGKYVYDRHSERRAREAGEIGIHSIRAGTIIGDHDVILAGKDEVITLSHSALSREMFASGALRAASFLIGKPAGYYTMDDIVAQYMQ